MRPACTPASLAGWFAPPARLGARRSGRARARGSAARWQGWPVSADVLEVARRPDGHLLKNASWGFPQAALGFSSREQLGKPQSFASEVTRGASRHR